MSTPEKNKCNGVLLVPRIGISKILQIDCNKTFDYAELVCVKESSDSQEHGNSFYKSPSNVSAIKICQSFHGVLLGGSCITLKHVESPRKSQLQNKIFTTYLNIDNKSDLLKIFNIFINSLGNLVNVLWVVKYKESIN